MQFRAAIRSDRSESHQYEEDKVCMHSEAADKDEQEKQKGECADEGRKVDFCISSRPRGHFAES
jgi:hypothetical protein